MTSREKEKKNGRPLVMAVAVTGALALLAACGFLSWSAWNVWQEKIETHPERAPRYAFGTFEDGKTRLVEATLPLIDCARSDALFPGDYLSFESGSKAGDCVPEDTWSDALETVRGAGCTVRDVRRYSDSDFMTERALFQFVCEEVSA